MLISEIFIASCFQNKTHGQNMSLLAFKHYTPHVIALTPSNNIAALAYRKWASCENHNRIRRLYEPPASFQYPPSAKMLRAYYVMDVPHLQLKGRDKLLPDCARPMPLKLLIHTSG